MPCGEVSEQEILDALRQLPTGQWSDVLRFVEALQTDAKKSAGANPLCTAEDLAGSDLVGIWADREDIDDSRTFASRLREQAERR